MQLYYMIVDLDEDEVKQNLLEFNDNGAVSFDCKFLCPLKSLHTLYCLSWKSVNLGTFQIMYFKIENIIDGRMPS